MTGLAAVEKLNVEEDFFEKEYTERITRPGPIKFTAILCNDCYKGLDQFEKHTVDVVATSGTRREYKYRKADLRALKDTATFFKPDPDDLESDESEEEVLMIDNKVEDNLSELSRKLKKAGLQDAVSKLKETINDDYKDPHESVEKPATPFIPASSKNLWVSKRVQEKNKELAEERKQK